MAQGKEYFAFISYKREDEKWAKWLQHKLEHYHLPINVRKENPSLPQSIRPVFKDTSELAAGVLADEIHEALDNSKYLIVICSPRAAQSEWVGKEVQTFIDMGRSDKIIPFIIGGAPFSDNPEEECFPSALLNLPKEQELLGVNINEMGREAAVVKVVARMFGLKFDTLWQRYEREQKRKRWMWIDGSVLLALFGLGIGGYFVRQNGIIESQNKRLQNDSIIMANHIMRIQNDSILLSSQNDSIERQYVLISNQRDSLNLSNELLAEERDNVIRANMKFMENQGRAVASKAEELINEGNIYLAIRLLLNVSPNNTNKYPYIEEVERALRHAKHELDREGFNPVAVMEGGSGNSVYYADFFNNDQYIYTLSSGNSNLIWSVQNGKRIKNIESNKGTYISPSKNHWYRLSNRNLLVFDKTNTRLINNIKRPTGILNAQWSPKGSYIIGRDSLGQFVYDIELNKILFDIPMNTYSEVSVSTDEKLLSVTEDDSISIWNIKSKKCIATGNLGSTIRCHTFIPDKYEILYSLNNEYNEEPLRKIDLNTSKITIVKDGLGIIDEIRFDKHGKYIYTGNIDGNNRLWKYEDMSLVCQKFDPAGHYGIEAPFTFNSKYIFFANTLWKNQSFSFPYYHEEGTWKYQYNNNGSLLIAIGRNKIKIINGNNNSLIKEIPKGAVTINHICFDRHSNYVAMSTLDHYCILWNIKNDSVFTLKHRGWQIGCSTFIEDCKMLATACSDSTIVLWDIHHGKEIKKLKGHVDFVEYVAYSPESKLLASGSRDGTIRFWDIKSGKEIDRIENENVGWVETIQFDKKGEQILSAYSNNIAIIWDIRSKKEIKRYHGIEKLTSAFYDPSNKHIIISSHNSNESVLDIWNIQDNKWIDRIKIESQFERGLFLPNGNAVISYFLDTPRYWDFMPYADLIQYLKVYMGDYSLSLEEKKKYYLDD